MEGCKKTLEEGYIRTAVQKEWYDILVLLSNLDNTKMLMKRLREKQVSEFSSSLYIDIVYAYCYLLLFYDFSRIYWFDTEGGGLEHPPIGIYLSKYLKKNELLRQYLRKLTASWSR